MDDMTIAEALRITRPKFLTTGEVCALLRVCEKTVQRWRKAGVLTYTMRGGKYIYPASDIDRFIAARTTYAVESTSRISNPVESSDSSF